MFEIEQLKTDKEHSQFPPKCSAEVLKIIKRIELHHNVVGVVFFQNDDLKLGTLPGNMLNIISSKLPLFSKLVQTTVGEITALINRVNPIVDRIIDDDSVESVIMTNKEGVPIFTNINVVGATPYGLELQKYGALAQAYIKELDLYDEVITLRLKTKKMEILVAPHPEFNIIVVQHVRIKNN